MKIIPFFSKNTKLDLEKVIAGCLQQNENCQRLLFNMYAPKILTTCRRYANTSLDANDILQDTFIRVFEKIHQFDAAKGNIEAWMRRIAVNIALKALRKKLPDMVDLDEVPEILDVEHGEDMNDITEEEILTMISSLPLGYKTVFNLFVIEGLSHQEIANELQISVQTSKSQLFKAKQLLKEKINNLNGARRHQKQIP
jgi:RNA polymerase sigma factor (sigma-70 family)